MGFKQRWRASGSGHVRIRNTDDFQRYLHDKSNSGIFESGPEAATSICGIAHGSDTLLVMPRTVDLNNIAHYGALALVQLNNVSVGDDELSILRAHRARTARVESLCFWNVSMADLACLECFPAVRHLLLAHLRGGFSFRGLEHLGRLETLCVLKAPGLADLRWSRHVASERLANLSIENARHLKTTAGIEAVAGLRYVSLVGAETTYSMDRLDGVSELTRLAELELANVRVPPDALVDALGALAQPIRLAIDPNLYEARVYKRLAAELGHVESEAFGPFVRDGSRVTPVGKNKRSFDVTAPGATQKMEALEREWADL